MKTGVSLSTFPSSPGQPILFSQNYEQNLSAIKELGFDGVDFFMKSPEDEETKKAVASLKKHGVGIGVILPASMAQAGLFLGDDDESVRRELISRMEGIVNFAAGFGANVALGLVRGYISRAASSQAFYDHLSDSIGKLLKVARPAGVKLLIEPINRYEIDNINSTAQAIDYIRRSGLELSIMADTFHMNIEDESICASFVQAGDLTAHVQLTDSNRLAPGMGHSPMKDTYAVLEAIGYTGYLSLECPSIEGIDSLSIAQKGAEFFGSVKKSVA